MKRVEMTGKNVLLNDDRGKESVMVRIPKFLISDVIPGGPDTVHPAFIVEGEEKECIYVSKYQNVVRGDRAYSLPGEDPSVLYTIEEAEKFCRDKGPGWHLMTSAEWAAVALWSQRNETLPGGNNDNGRYWKRIHERGTIVSLDGIVPEGEQGPPMRVATGSGPASWSHDGTNEGIFDLNGNIWEMTSGLRLKDGVLETTADNDAASNALDDAEWNVTGLSMKAAVSEKGETFIQYGFAGESDEAQELLIGSFGETVVETDDEDTKQLLQRLCLIPVEDACSCQDAVWGVPEGVRYPIRGGYWVNKEKAGIYACGFYMRPDDRYFDVGFRCCYVEK